MKKIYNFTGLDTIGHPETWRQGWPVPFGVVVRLGFGLSSVLE